MWQHMPVCWKSPNHIDPTAAWKSLHTSVGTGHVRPQAQSPPLGRGRACPAPTGDAREFFATEAAFCSVPWWFNLLAEFQRAAGSPGYREPATIRAQALTCGSILGRSGRCMVVHLSQSRGGLKIRIPLRDSPLHWQTPTSPKLDPMLVT